MNKHFDFIFLIISSSDIPQYLQMKELSRKYYNLFSYNIKHFYIEFKNDLECDILEQEEHIFIKGIDSIVPGILTKTQKALLYINNKYNCYFCKFNTVIMCSFFYLSWTRVSRTNHSKCCC